MSAITYENSVSDEDKAMIELFPEWDEIKNDEKALFKTWESSFKKFPVAKPPGPVSSWLYRKLNELIASMPEDEFIEKHFSKWEEIKDDFEKLRRIGCDLADDMRYSPSSYILKRMYRMTEERLSELSPSKG